MSKKYLIWIPSKPNFSKWFINLKTAKRYCNKQKIEACINVNVNTDKEDTIYSNGVNYV
jgi:uncharacterized membrane protein YbaN (DUF454 family)